MQIRSRPTAVLLAIIAVLLAAHLLVRLGGQEAQAQSDLLSAVPRVVALSDFEGGHVLRLWSDGRVEWTQRLGRPSCVTDPPFCEWVLVPGSEIPPPELSPGARPVGLELTNDHVYRQWSDGTLDWNTPDPDLLGTPYQCGVELVWCGWTTVPQ